MAMHGETASIANTIMLFVSMLSCVFCLGLIAGFTKCWNHHHHHHHQPPVVVVGQMVPRTNNHPLFQSTIELVPATRQTRTSPAYQTGSQQQQETAVAVATSETQTPPTVVVVLLESLDQPVPFAQVLSVAATAD
jgi:hypothetical protein